MKQANYIRKGYAGGSPAACAKTDRASVWRRPLYGGTQRPFCSWLSALGLIAMTAFAQGAQAVTYANKSIPFSWVNTSTHTHVGYNTTPYKFNGTIAPGTACGTAPPTLDDTISDNIPFGFSFNYGGAVFTSARVMSNGRLQFNNNTACGFGSPVTQLPYVYYNSATDNLNYSMRIYGNDLDPTPQVNAPYTTACASTATCYISYASIGTVPNRQFVVTWNNIPEWAAGGSTSGNYNLQLILNEDGSFIYQYGPDTAGPQAATAQVGWQVSQTDYDIPSVGLPANNSAILFYIPSPVAQYHFQQSIWTAPGQVLDTGGGTPVYNGTALGAATPGSGYVCNGAVIPYNSNVSIDAIDTGIPVTTALGGTGTIDFWYKANAAWVGGGDAQLLDATTTNNQWFFAVKRNNGDIRFVLTDSTGTLQAVETGANNIPAGTWTHIALTWNFNALAGSNKDHMSVYINGTQVKLQVFTTSGTVSSSLGTLYLGDNRASFTGSNGTRNSANGTLDEVNIYNFEGGSGLIQRDMNYTASCGGLDHLMIQSSGSGLTCAASTLTVVACQDATCATPYTGGISGTLSATGTPTVNWDGTTGGAAGSGFVIPGGSSSVNKNVQVATAGTITFSVATATPTPANPTTCNFGTNTPSNNNCVFTANTAGFIFSDTTTGSAYTIPAQVSGIATPTLYLRALQAATNNPAVCTPAIIGQTTAVNMGYVCNNPAACQAGNLATVNATAIAPGGTAVNLTFDANGSAPITARYDDVGRVTLNANKTVTPFGGGTAITLNGNSNSFVVAPHHFDLSGIQRSSDAFANPAAADATGAKFVKAGENFTITVTARNFANAATPNFGKETTPEGVKLAPTLATGLGLTNNPAIGGTFGTFTNGVATGTAFTWNEVGIIKLTPSVGDGDYLGVGDVTGTASGNVGRFYAAQFGLSAGSIVNRTDVCPAAAGCPAAFTYMDERMDAEFTLAAQAVGGTTTQNYNYSATAANNFAKLNPTTVGNPLVFGAVDSTATPAYLTSRLDTSLSATGNFVNGNGTANVVAPLAIGRGGAADGPYASLDIGIAPVDSDGALMAAYDIDTDAIAGNDHTKVARTEVRYGRMKISNAHGSELLPLTINVAAQFWNGTTYVTNTLDNSSTFASTGVNFVSYTGNLNGANYPNSGATAVTPASVVFVNGAASYKLAKPGAGLSGSVDMTVSVLSAYLPSNTARATFGVYKGNKEFIYLRENY